MPLHAQPERPFGILDGFNGAVGRTSRSLETRMGDNRLPMVTADLHPITDKGADSGALPSADRGPTECVATGRVLLMPHNIW